MYSAAAYIITKKTVQKFLRSFMVLSGHVDIDMYVNCKIQGIKIIINENLFITDENESTNRIKSKRTLYSYILDSYGSSVEKTNSVSGTYKVIRIRNYHLTVREINLIVFTLFFFIIPKGKYLKNICILYVLVIMIYGLELF